MDTFPIRPNFFAIITSLTCLLASENFITVNPQESNQNTDAKQTSGNWNLKLKTLGGKQFWTDAVHFHGYRIQENVTTGHFRLVDPANVRQAWGTFDHCKEALQEIGRRKGLEPMTGKVLIVLHGLIRTRSAMNSISKHIAAGSDLTVLNISYASTRQPIAAHARALDSIIRHLPSVDEIYFLGHSMGNIVVRYYLGMLAEQGRTDPRFRRMVMLAPPNNGSRFAQYWQNNVVFKSVMGKSGQDLSSRWDEVETKLATPTFEFGIIAGAQKDGAFISNTIVEGKDDFVVGVEETKLVGASDFLVQPLIHSTMMNDVEVQQAALRFLLNGYFVPERERRPIVTIDGDSPR